MSRAAYSRFFVTNYLVSSSYAVIINFKLQVLELFVNLSIILF